MRARVEGEESPLAMLERLVAGGASGEFVAASEHEEVHVYVLDGRLAWGTASSAPSAFTTYLIEECGVAAATLREVFDECQRTRKRLGETLVAWRIATPEQVASALREQIGQAIMTLSALHGARALFLPRRMEYARELTFALGDLPLDLRRCLGGEPDDRADALTEGALDAIADACWAGLVRDGALAGSSQRPGADRSAPGVVELAAIAAAEGLDAVALRTPSGTILGQIAAGESLWCLLEPGGKVGVAAAVLASLLPGTAGEGRPPPRGPWRAPANPAPLATLAPLAHAFENADELGGAVILGPEPLVVHRLACEPGRLVARAARLRALLDAPGLPTLRASWGDLTCHAGALGRDRSLSLWLFLDPAAPQGLGWALLTSLSRQLMEPAGKEDR